MKRSTDRILTTHAGRLANPSNIEDFRKAKASGDQVAIDAAVTVGIIESIQRQKDLKNDIHSDGEFWKGRDQAYFNARSTGVEAQTATNDKPASMLAHMQERHNGLFDDFFAAFDRVGNAPLPGQDNPPPLTRWAITGPMETGDGATSKHEVAVVAAALEKAGVDKEDFFFPVISPGWLGHSVWNEYYKTEEEYVYAMAEFFRQDYEAVTEAGFVLQIDDPDLVDAYCMFWPEISIAEYRKYVDLRIEALNYALRNVPEDLIRYHTCWGSWHTPHTTDLPFEHTVDIMLKVKAAAYSVEAADAQHILDYKVWDKVKWPDGKIYIPGVVAHKTATVEPPEVVADRIITYANIMGKENVIAGTDCGYGGRTYPDVGWAKMRAMAAGAELATKQLWG
jgi:5-methyltetrahydropteroyltriglutamate--homocysteine methyltransferase